MLLPTGCTPDHPAPPMERNELVTRFFSSMKNGDSKTAAAQGTKLLAMDPANDYIAKLIMVQQGNLFIQRAQEKLNAGDVNAAIAIIDEGIAAYPLNRMLAQLRGSLRRVRNLPRLIQAMRDADSSTAMNAALTAATVALAGETTPRLETYFKDYRARIAMAAAAEKAAVPQPQPPAATAK